MVIMAGTWWTSYQTHNVQNKSISSILLKNQSQKITKKLRFLLWTINHSLQSYMIDPDHVLRKKINKTIENTLKQINYLKNINIAEEHKWDNSINVLNIKVTKLQNMLNELMTIRVTPKTLHPAMSTMNDIMLPASNEFSTAATLAIEEIEFENLVINNQIYKLFEKISSNWNKMIGAFRVFVANRFGAFSSTEEGLKQQGYNVELLYNAISKDLQLLKTMSTKVEFDMQGQESLDIMIVKSKEWFNAYQSVRKSYLSKLWRTDVPYLHKRIQPTLLNIWMDLNEIDRIIDIASNKSISAMSNIAGNISNILWVFFIIAFIFTIAGYMFFQSSIISPIKKLSTALFNQAHGSDNNKIEEDATLGEMKELHQAFSLMKTKVHERQTELQLKALHDPLTGLPNRVLMEDRLDQALSISDRSNNVSAIMLIDLNKFKEINDNFGHYVGDHILKETSRRLQSVLRTTGTVSRIGGDEFAIIIPNIAENGIDLVIQRIMDTFDDPCLVDDLNITIKMSIGISIYPKDGRDAVTLLKNADSAMYIAKKHWQTVCYFKNTDTL